MKNKDESTVDRRPEAWQEPDIEAGTGVSERFRQARRAGNPAWLWPEIPVRQWRSALLTLESTARGLLTGAHPQPLRAADAADGRALGLASYTSGLGPWLAWYIEQGRLEADERSTQLLGEQLVHARIRWSRVEAQLGDVLGALSRCGVRATVLKGAYGARRWFAEPALRPLADVDVRVPADAMARCAQALRAAGYEEQVAGRSVHPPRSEWRRRGSSPLPRSLMLVHADDPIAVDLHGSLDIDFFGIATIHFDAVESRFSEQVQMAGSTVRVLAQPLLAAHHAVHASYGLHGLTLIRLVELALMLRHDLTSAPDRDPLGALLTELRAERFAWPALALTEQLAPGSVAPAVLARCAAAAPPRLRRVVERLQPATAQRIDTLDLQERFMWSRGFGEHARRAVNMLVPTGSGGPKRLGRIYVDRMYRLLRRRVGWSAERG